jgi:hypothetical protein
VSGFFEPGKPTARARAQGAGLGILLVVGGAFLLFALTASSLHVVGVILIVAGALVLLSVLAHAMLSASWLRTTWFSPGTSQGNENADPDYSPGDDQNDL